MASKTINVVFFAAVCTLLIVEEATSTRLCGAALSRAVYRVCSHGKRGYPMLDLEEEDFGQELDTEMDEFLAQALRGFLESRTFAADIESDRYFNIPQRFRRNARGGIARRCCSSGCSTSDIAKLC
nr:relaxin-like gonad stimulating peptide [Holothuria fuscogilva]